MQVKLDELRRQNDRVERALDSMADILLLIRTEKIPERRELLWDVYGRARIRMNTESARLNELIEQIRVEQKERRIMRTRLMTVTVILIAALLLVSGLVVAVAQDEALSTNTPQIVEDVTPAATEILPVPDDLPVEPVPADQPSPFERILAEVNWTIIILVLIVAFFGFISYVVKIVGAAIPVTLWEGGKAGVRSNYTAIDERVAATPDPVDDFLWKVARERIEGLIGEVDELRAQVAARMNAKAPATPTPTIPDPDPFKPQYPVDGTPGVG